MLDLDDIRKALKEDEKTAKFVSEPGYFMNDGLLFYMGKIVIPRSLRQTILETFHAGKIGGHLGVEKTYKLLSVRYFWRGMKKDVENFVKRCEKCQKFKGYKKEALLTPITVENVFDLVAMDIVGPLPTSKNGNRFLLVFVEYVTKWPEVYAIPNQESITIAKIILNEFIPRHGIPRRLLSDRGTNLLSEIMRQLYQILGVSKDSTTSYNPQCDGLVESVNKTLINILKNYVNEYKTNWDEKLPFALTALRISENKATGCSPFELMYGRTYNHILEVPNPLRTNPVWEEFHKSLQITRDLALISNELNKTIQKETHDKKVKEVREFEVGDYVYMWNNVRKKFDPNWIGPYEIIEKFSPNTYKLKLPNKRMHNVVHINKLKMSNTIPTEIIPDENDVFEVDRILNERIVNNKKEYRVRWLGFKQKDDSWIPEEEMLSADPIAIKIFEETKLAQTEKAEKKKKKKK
jgi:hypothetical protein